MLCATTPLGISSVFVCTYCLLMPCVLLCTNITTLSRSCLSREESFSKVKHFCTKITYYSICYNYGVNSDKIKMNGNWFYTTDSVWGFK